MAAPLLRFTSFAAVLFLAACNRDGGTGDGATGAAPSSPGVETGTGTTLQAHRGSGTVTAVDVDAQRVTIAHEPMPALDWPAMTMAFDVTRPDALQGVEVGQKVIFSLRENSPGIYRIVEIQRQ